MDNFTQIQMNDTREINVTTPYKADLQQFTPEQIEHYCKNIECLCQFGMVNETRLKKGIRIIKQLQEEVRGVKLWKPVKHV